MNRLTLSFISKRTMVVLEDYIPITGQLMLHLVSWISLISPFPCEVLWINSPTVLVDSIHSTITIPFLQSSLILLNNKASSLLVTPWIILYTTKMLVGHCNYKTPIMPNILLAIFPCSKSIIRIQQVIKIQDILQVCNLACLISVEAPLNMLIKDNRDFTHPWWMSVCLIWVSSYKGTNFNPMLLVQFKHNNHTTSLVLTTIYRYQFCFYVQLFGV